MRSKAQSLGIVDAYDEVASNIPDGIAGSQLVLTGYNWYRENYDTSSPRQRPINGKVFECLVLDALWAHGIRPAYHQARVEHVPHVVYDIVLYHPKRPVVLSCKTSLRERWKQADLEGLALKQVYRAAQSVLITLSNEGRAVQRYIHDSNVIGLDSCIVIAEGRDDFDRLMDDLRDSNFTEASMILPVTGTIMK